jgi:hypothetical protein
LNVIAAGNASPELRYTAAIAREMTRLHRKLERRLPRKAGDEKIFRRTGWRRSSGRRGAGALPASAADVIPAYAEGVCPRCQQTRKVLWRLLDVAQAVPPQVWAALG